MRGISPNDSSQVPSMEIDLIRIEV